MNDDAIRRAVIECLEDVAPDVDAATIDPQESLREELDLDSMDFLAFVRGLHERLGVSVPEVDYPSLDSLDGAVSYLREHGAG